MKSDRWIRRLLCVLPFDFRSDYGREIEQVFREERREAAARGTMGVLRVWLGMAIALLAIARASTPGGSLRGTA